jgi:hypothetical protein
MMAQIESAWASSQRTYIINEAILRTVEQNNAYFETVDRGDSNKEVRKITRRSGSELFVSPYTIAQQNAKTEVFVPLSLTFQQLIEQWHRERGATSSITEMAMCPAYQSIIALGPEAIPLILRQMESEGNDPDMWFWALQVMTRVDPIEDDDRGDTVRMAQAWLNWGRQRYAW